MVIVASKDTVIPVQGSPPGELCLRIVGSARDGQLVKLSAVKCSIGSAEGCTLRLRARGVRPVHCLVLRGARGTVARAWAPNTRLNGEPFRDALLTTGDRLSIGPVEFEVVSAEGPPADPFEAGRTVVLDRRPAQGPTYDNPLTPALLAPARRNGKRWRAHVRRLVSEVRKLRLEIDRFQQEVPAQAQETTQAAQIDELRQRAEDIRQQNAQWEATLASLQNELDSRGQQLEVERADLAAAQAELAARRQQWEGESSQTREQLALRETDHRRACDTLEASQLEWQRRQAEMEAELAAVRTQLDERQRQLEQLSGEQRELEARQTELAELAARLDERAQSLTQQQTEIDGRLAESQRAGEELTAARSAFEAEQAAALRSLEEQRGAIDAKRLAAEDDTRLEAQRVQALREAVEQRENANTALTAELAAAGTALKAWLETESESYDQRCQELDRRGAELQQREVEIERREAAIGQREAELEQRAANLEQREANVQQREADPPIIQPSPAVDGQLPSFEADFALERLAELANREATLQRSRDELAVTEASFAQQQAEALAELEARRAELAESENRQQQLAEVNQRAVAQLRSESDELNRRERDLAAGLARLQAEQEALAAAAAPTSEPAPAAANPTVEPTADRAELEAALARLAADREQLEADRADFERIRARTSQRLDDDARELAEQREQLDAEREAWQQRQQSETFRARTPAPQFADEDLEEDDEPAAYSEFSPQRVRPADRDEDRSQLDTLRAPAHDTVRQPKPIDDDESMESHIAAFMDRLRGSQPVPPIAPEPPSRRKRKSDPRPAEVEPQAPSDVSAVVAGPEVPVLDMPAAPREIERRRSKLEEDPKNLSVLREIGLSHARSAIDTHGQQRSLKQAYGTLATSGACFVAAFIVLWFSKNVVMHTAGIAVLVVGIYWMASSIWAAQKVLTVMKRRRHAAGGLRATLAEVEAELDNLRKEAEEEIEA